jgi:ATP-binding cassette subfamily B (MDR/TAP) protein 1
MCFPLVQRIGKSVQATRDLERLVSLKTETVEAQGKSRYHLQGDITFHHVDFVYPSRPEVQILKDFDFKINQGQCVAIVGASGCGKSTIAGLLQRLYEPTGGFISINGHRLSDTNTPWLRNRVAIVSQQPHLFDASVDQNIAYGTDITEHARIVQAAKEANVHDFIMTLPQGYNTHLGENASLISGGQAQRIQIARALVRNSSILILDECTSALDVENQRAVMSTIKRIKLGRTTVVITHKLPVMQMADRILVIDGGGVAEEGTYDDLMSRKGTFWKLATAGEWEGE